jgi:hypothetical protein
LSAGGERILSFYEVKVARSDKPILFPFSVLIQNSKKAPITFCVNVIAACPKTLGYEALLFPLKNY